MTVVHEIISDGKTVWVNSGIDGMNLARFSRFGIDVHKDAAGQESGIQCLFCKPGPCDLEDWQAFRLAVLDHHGIYVPGYHMPKNLVQ